MATWNVSYNLQMKGMFDLSKANIEALAEGESVNHYATVECGQFSYIDPYTGRLMEMSYKHCEGEGDRDCDC